MKLKQSISFIKRQQITVLVLLIFLLLIFCPVISFGQKTSEIDIELSGNPKDKAPVKIDGKVLFYVGGISTYTAKTRAATIESRIKNAAANDSVSSDSIKIIADESTLKIFAGPEFIMNVYALDSEREGINQKILASLAQTKIQDTIVSFRHNRSRPVLMKKLFYGIVALVILILLLFLLRWFTRMINNVLKRWLRSKIDTLEDKSYRLIRSDHFWIVFNMGFRAVKILSLIVLIGIFLQYILGLLPWTNNIAASILELVMNPLRSIGNGIFNYIPSLFFLIIIFIITRYLLKLIKMLFTGISHGSIEIHNFYPEWAMPTFKILRAFIIAFAIIVSYPYIPGSESVAFKGVTVFLGLLLSLGSSSFIGNIIAGYSMIYRRAFKIGDRIEVDGKIGFVEEQKMLVTRLRSHKNEEIVIPNSVLMNSHIINYSSREEENGLILHTVVGIGYETPWRLVDAMLMMAADRTQGLLKEPSPFVLKKSLGDYAVNYELNVYCKDISGINTHYTNLHQNILDVFNENKIQIMTPSYVADPEIPKVVPKDQWDTKLSGDNDVKH